MLKGYLHGLLDLVFPRNCILSKRYLENLPPTYLHPSIYNQIAFNSPPFCLLCSRHLKGKTTQGICKTCHTHHPEFDWAWGACIYDQTLRKLLRKFKFEGKTSLRHTFSNIIIHFLDQHHISLDQFDLMIPTPLHPTRLRERGFNQSFLIAQILAKHYQIKLDTASLKRHRFTENQTKFNQKERFTNVGGAFKISLPININNKNILIVDDLLTTGATTSAMASTLKEHGANQVGVLALALA